jgi:phage shock protein PspC (stress-responsive transcriptional regulator)
MKGDSKKCPYCCEEIHVEANKCRWCGSSFRPEAVSSNWERDLPGRIFLGVARRLSEKTDVHANIWRIGFIASSFIYGFGILVYFTIWALTPFRQNEPSPLESGIEMISGIFKSLFSASDNGKTG